MPELDLPVPGVTGSPQWALKLNAALETLSDAVDDIEPGATISNSDAIPQGTTNLYMTGSERTKLSGISTGATANSTDAQLRDRSSHTGSQAISTVTGLQTALDGKSAVTHTHPQSDVTGLTAALSGKANTTHSHAISEVTNLQSTLDGKAASSHTHTIANVTGLQTALDNLEAASAPNVVLVLGPSEPVPVGTPANTIIVRRTS